MDISTHDKSVPLVRANPPSPSACYAVSVLSPASTVGCPVNAGRMGGQMTKKNNSGSTWGWYWQKQEDAGEVGHHSCPHLADCMACSPNRTVSSATACSCWLLHIVQKSEMWSSKWVLPISELCCFITFQKRCTCYNPVHSISDSGVAMPAAEFVFTIHDIFTTRSRGR